MGYESKLLKFAWIPFNLIKKVHANFSRPENVNVSTSSDDKALADSLKEHGWIADFHMVVEDLKDNFYGLHGGNRRFSVINTLVNEGKLPNDFGVYCAIYDTLTANERIDLNLSHNPIRIGEANPATVQEFERCWDNWSKTFTVTNGSKSKSASPEDSEADLQRCMRLSSRGKSQGFYPLLAIGKLIPELKVLERVKDSLSKSPNRDAIVLGKAQSRKGDSKKLLDEIKLARANRKGDDKAEKLASLATAFNNLWIIDDDANAPKRMSADKALTIIAGNDNPIVALAGNADLKNDAPSVQFSKKFNEVTTLLLQLKDNDVALTDIATYINELYLKSVEA